MELVTNDTRKMRALTFTTAQFFFMLTDADLNRTTIEAATADFSDYTSTNETGSHRITTEAATSHFSNYESTDETISHHITTEAATSHFSNYESTDDTNKHQKTISATRGFTNHTPTKDAIVGILFTLLIVSLVVLFAWNFQNHRKRRMQNSLSQQPKNCLTTVDNITHDDVITRSESDQKQNDVAYSNTQIYENQKLSSMETEDIYVEKDDDQYDHLHSIRHKLTESQQEDRYATATELNCFYSTAGQIRKDSPVLDDEYINIVRGIHDGNFCKSLEDTSYDHTYQRARSPLLT